MYLIYIDESGNTGARKDPAQPIHLIGAMMVECEKVRTLEDGVAAIVKTHLPNLAQEEGFEIHAADMFNGAGLFRGVDPTVRIAVVEELIKLLTVNEIRLGWTAVDKIKLWKSTHHELAFLLLVERIENFLIQRERLGLIVADENKEVEQRLIDDLSLYKRHRTNFGYKKVPVRSIIDSVHFVQSKNNLLIQCTDVMAYFLLRGYRTNTDLLSRYAMERSSQPYPDWVATIGSRKERILYELFSKIKQLVEFGKLFPD